MWGANRHAGEQRWDHNFVVQRSPGVVERRGPVNSSRCIRPDVGKLLHVNAGHQLSVQYFHKKDEAVHLRSGELIRWAKLSGSDDLRA